MSDIDHVAVCRIYADELLGEPAVSRCLHAGADEIERLTAEVERLRTVTPSLEEANAMLVAAQHIEAYLGRPSEQSILLRDLCRRVREIQ